MKKISLRETWRRFKMDIHAFARHTRVEKLSWRKCLSCFMTPAIQVLVLYRLSHYFFIKGHGVIARFFYTLNLIIFGADIGIASDIGGGCYIPHTVGLGIYGDLGENIFISHQVGIGGGMISDADIGAGSGLPVIESDVYIGAKSSIQGPIRIGRGSLIGLHALVIKDVPPNTIAMGVPARNTRRLSPGELETITLIPPKKL